MNIEDEFKNWNPMREDFEREAANQYDAMGEVVDVKSPEKHVVVIMNFDPKKVNNKIIYNLCNRHGSVRDINMNHKKTHYFVTFSTLAEAEAVCRALKNNSYDMRVEMGKRQQETSAAVNNQKLIKDSFAGNEPTGQREVDKRSFPTSTKLHPRPQIPEDYKKILVKLPGSKDKGYVIEGSDAHELERSGLPYPKTTWHGSLKYHYAMGRAHLNMSKSTEHFLERKIESSQGKFHESSQRYNNSDQPVIPKSSLLDKCWQCNKACDSVCARCGTYFCGIDCQKEAWLKHRVECTPPSKKARRLAAKAEPVAEPTKAFIESVAMPPPNSVVCISAISKNNVVFIRPHNPEFNTKFVQFISELQRGRSSYIKLREQPRNGTMVIGCYQGVYSRALVLSDVQQNGLARVIFVDHGNIGNLPWQDLYEIPVAYKTTSFLANPVVLRDVTPASLTAELKNFLYAQLEDVLFVVKYNKRIDLVPNQGVYTVDLINEATRKNLSEEISALATPKESKAEDNTFFTYNYLEQIFLPTGKNIDLVVMDNSMLSSGCLSCTTQAHALEIQKFERDIQRYAGGLPQRDFCPRVDELCIAKYSKDGKWYRGRCLELLGDGYPTILFIDYGNLASVSITDLLPYPAAMTFPVYTCDCEIEGLPEDCDDNMVAKLEELLPNGQAVHCDRIAVNKEANYHTLTIATVLGEIAKMSSPE